MIHVRVVCPPDETAAVLGALDADPAVLNLIVGPGAARNPSGDAIQFDLIQGGANAVLARLREFAIEERGSITLGPVTASMSATATQAGRGRSRFDRFAPVWEEVDARIRSDGTYPPSWYALLVIAGLIGSVGLVTNSQILIVGAMVVGPEYGAIVALALGVVRRGEARCGVAPWP